MDSELHPAEKVLLEDCKRVGLNEGQTEIMRDLFGWKDRSIPFSLRYLFIMASMVATREFIRGGVKPKQLSEIAELSDLVNSLMGEALLSLVREDPMHILEEVLSLPRQSVAWITVQLELEEYYRRLEDTINSLCYYSPERMALQVVIPAIGVLMRSALKNK